MGMQNYWSYGVLDERFWKWAYEKPKFYLQESVTAYS